jgi:hypothetical protein
VGHVYAQASKVPLGSRGIARLSETQALCLSIASKQAVDKKNETAYLAVLLHRKNVTALRGNLKYPHTTATCPDNIRLTGSGGIFRGGC